MRIHILGICGTFMAGVAVLAKQLGLQVEGSDENVYPPMSTQLEEQDITLKKDYKVEHLKEKFDDIVIGNVMGRGKPVVEHILNQGLKLNSGPQWLAENVLKGKHVLAVAGTHGKTTTSSMLAWILEFAGLNPGFLIGGIPKNFGLSARLGSRQYFVIEADEYDTAFFDKRSKFVHYRARTVILNNLEFDHADIFENLAAIQKQFHHWVRTIPSEGLIVHPSADKNVDDVLKMGCWTPCETFGASGVWGVENMADDGHAFDVMHHGKNGGRVEWSMLGQHNVNNALAAIAASHHVGVGVDVAIKALAKFEGVKRRLELRGVVNGVKIFDDFAHHPTAIETTLQGLRKNVGNARIIVALDPASNTMKAGVHKDHLSDSLQEADMIFCKRVENAAWDMDAAFAHSGKPVQLFSGVDDLLAAMVPELKSGDCVLVMSNSGFGGIHEKLLDAASLRGA